MKRLKTTRRVEYEMEFVKLGIISGAIFCLFFVSGYQISGFKILGVIYLTRAIAKILWNFISVKILLHWGEKCKVQGIRLYNTTKNSGHLHVIYDGNQEMYSENYYWAEGISQEKLAVEVYKYYGKYFLAVKGETEA